MLFKIQNLSRKLKIVKVNKPVEAVAILSADRPKMKDEPQNLIFAASNHFYGQRAQLAQNPYQRDCVAVSSNLTQNPKRRTTWNCTRHLHLYGTFIIINWSSA